MAIRDEIISMIQDYNRTHDGEEPTRISLTPADEMALASMDSDEAGGGVSGDVRKDWGTISGIVVEWDSPVRKCQ